jgi:hypothetical protein
VRRHPDWLARLGAYLEEVRERPFRWGSSDCALFAAGAVRAMTGADLGADWRGRYRSARGAARILRARGFAGLADVADAHFEAVAPASAGIGDLAAVPGDAGLALGVVQGAGVYVLFPEGLALIAREEAVRAWRV